MWKEKQQQKKPPVFIKALSADTKFHMLDSAPGTEFSSPYISLPWPIRAYKLKHDVFPWSIIFGT